MMEAKILEMLAEMHMEMQMETLVERTLMITLNEMVKSG